MARRTRHTGRHPTAQEPQIQYEYDKAIYKQRNVIGRMFCRLKDWRRIATRFDHNVKTSWEQRVCSAQHSAHR